MGFNRQGAKDYAPETAVGTGAAEPLVDEYEAAKATESVDESTIEGGRSNNHPRGSSTIDYSGEDPETTPSLDDCGATLGVKSTGEDYETRHADDDTLAGSSVSEDDSDVNKRAEDTHPERPQDPKRARHSKKSDS